MSLMWFSSFILKNLFRRLMRTLLTAFGISLAIGAMVSLLGITDGFYKSTVASFEKQGVDLLVTAGNVDQLSSSLDVKYKDLIASLPEVDKVGMGQLAMLDCQKPNGKAQFVEMVQGWPPGAFMFDGLKLLQGRLIQTGDKQHAILGPNVASSTGLGIGDHLLISQIDFEIVGIAQGVSNIEDGFVTIPLGEMQQITGNIDRVTGFSVVLKKDLKSTEKIEAFCDRIKELTNKDGKSLRLTATPTRKAVDSMMHIRLSRAMAWMTSIVAVLIGGIGMLNTMLMSVMERIREIGILRAVGWRKRRVVGMVLGEALVLSLLGAIVGILGAVVLTGLLSRLPSVNGFLSGEIAPLVMFQGLGIAVIVGLLGGLYPAWRAAMLLPTEAVRHE